MVPKDMKKTPRKPYQKPTLTEYGRVRDLTKSVANHPNPDGGNNAKNSRT